MVNIIEVDNIKDCMTLAESLVRNNYRVEIKIKMRESQLSCMRTPVGYTIRYEEEE